MMKERHNAWIPLALVAAIVICLILAVTTYMKYSDYGELEGRYGTQSQELASTQTELSSTEAELVSTESTLATTEVQLSSTQTQLSNTETKLSSTEDTLSSTQTKLSSTKTTLASTRVQLSNTQATLSGTKTELRTTQTTLVTTQTSLVSTQTALSTSQQQVVALQHTVSLYNQLGMTVYEEKQPPGGWYHLVSNPVAINPTWQQLKSFLLADPTDDRLYIEDAYMCGEFARDVHNNAEAVGIRAAWVFVDWGASLTAPHALNVFVTSDLGPIYIDCTGMSYPTSFELDKTAHVRIGELLTFTSIGPPYGDWIPLPIVSEIQVYW